MNVGFNSNYGRTATSQTNKNPAFSGAGTRALHAAGEIGKLGLIGGTVALGHTTPMVFIVPLVCFLQKIQLDALEKIATKELKNVSPLNLFKICGKIADSLAKKH